MNQCLTIPFLLYFSLKFVLETSNRCGDVDYNDFTVENIENLIFYL